MLEHALDYERRDWRPARNTRRFECGNPNMLDAIALKADLGLLEEVGMERIGRDITECTQWLQGGLSGIPGIRLHGPRSPSRRAGILTFSLDGQDSQTLFETLHQGRVIYAQCSGGIHFSPYFYTSSTVIDDTLAILRQVIGTQVLRNGEGIPNLLKEPPTLSGRPTNITNTERYWRVISPPKYPVSKSTKECVPLFHSQWS